MSVAQMTCIPKVRIRSFKKLYPQCFCPGSLETPGEKIGEWESRALLREGAQHLTPTELHTTRQQPRELLPS